MTSASHSGFEVDRRILLQATRQIKALEGELNAARNALAATKGLYVWVINDEIAKAGRAYYGAHPDVPQADAHIYDKILELGLQTIAQFGLVVDDVVSGLGQVASNYQGSDGESAKNLDAVD